MRVIGSLTKGLALLHRSRRGFLRARSSSQPTTSTTTRTSTARSQHGRRRDAQAAWYVLVYISSPQHEC